LLCASWSATGAKHCFKSALLTFSITYYEFNGRRNMKKIALIIATAATSFALVPVAHAQFQRNDARHGQADARRDAGDHHDARDHRDDHRRDDHRR